MKTKILPISTLLFLVACSLIPPVEKGENTLGIEDKEVYLYIIGNIPLQQINKVCIGDLLPECIVKAEGSLRVFPSDINDPLLTPNSITSKIGFKTARIDFSKAVPNTDVPDSFTLKELVIDILAQDGTVNEIPSRNQNVKLNVVLSENDLVELVFNQRSCSKGEICNYIVGGPKAIIDIRITEVGDFLNIFTKGNSQNTVEINIKTLIKGNVPKDSILILTLTNPENIITLF